MVERYLVLDNLKFSYEGLFSAAEVYSIIQSFFYEKGWDWKELLNQEITSPEGKQIRILDKPWKSAGDFHQIETKIKIVMNNVKDVEVEHQGKTITLNQGLIRITFDGYINSDRNDKWVSKPLKWFFLIIAEKYLYHSNIEKYENWLKSDIDDLLNKIKSYLNVYKYSYQT
jgi:hypothetical protein